MCLGKVINCPCKLFRTVWWPSFGPAWRAYCNLSGKLWMSCRSGTAEETYLTVFVRLLARAKHGIAHRIRSKQRHQLFPSWHLSNTQEFKCGLLQDVLWFMPTKIGLLGYFERSCPLRTHRLATTLGWHWLSSLRYVATLSESLSNFLASRSLKRSSFLFDLLAWMQDIIWSNSSILQQAV